MPRGFGSRARCVSRSAMWMPLTPARCIKRAQSGAGLRLVDLKADFRATSSSACLTNHDTIPGLAPQQLNGGDAAGAATAQGQHALAQRIVRARRDRQGAVGIKSGPRLDHGVEVKGAEILGELHEIDRGGVDREVDNHAAARPGGEERGQYVAVVLLGDRHVEEPESRGRRADDDRRPAARSRRISSGRRRCAARSKAACLSRSSRSRSSRSGRRNAHAAATNGRPGSLRSCPSVLLRFVSTVRLRAARPNRGG